ncbi:hypothetical protein PENTCL1PPCAC_24081 [Pristionchus entomophagus]|uniref:RING-type domain-containing protein n=1 Tax=Pristionchus entomophagus TaxID=358040 RepID=A0AAV5U5V0_9BILA|nr:hypothetical protein PENTCL1PPCAC_24081 [Pristionchus entomophagus]
MDVDRLTLDQQAIFWEVLEWYPQASRAAVIARIDHGLEAIISQCDDGTIPMNDETMQRDEIELAIQLSMNPDEQYRPKQQQWLQQQPQQPDVSVARVLHVDQAAPVAAAAYPLGVAAAAAPPAPTCSKPAAAAVAEPAQSHSACAICRKTTNPTALCHWPINRADGDKKEEDPRAHACCRKCINLRYLEKRIAVTSRVAIACLQKNCKREIHQDRLIDDALLKAALVQWMLGNTDQSVADAREANTKKELKRNREEEPEITEEERERLILIIDRMDTDKFTCLVDLLPEIDFTWILDHIDRGSIDTIYDQKTMQGDAMPKRKRRRLDKKGVTNLVEDRLKLETTFDCSVCFEETSKILGVPCVIMGSEGDGGDTPHSHDQHLFCGACVQGHAEAAVEQTSIVRAGLGLKCMQPDCSGVLIYAHIEPLLAPNNREIVEEKIAAAALDAAAVNVERCQRCPFAAIVDLPISDQQTFDCRRCNFKYCRNCNREWSTLHEGKTCEELNPEFIRRKVEAALSGEAVGMLQRCPSCGVAFEKNGGCNTMHCRCGKAFPYAGPRVLTPQQRTAIIQQHVAEAAGDESVVEEINKIR